MLLFNSCTWAHIAGLAGKIAAPDLLQLRYSRLTLMFHHQQTRDSKAYEPWCTFLATTICTLISFPHEDIITLTQPRHRLRLTSSQPCPADLLEEDPEVHQTAAVLRLAKTEGPELADSGDEAFGRVQARADGEAV